MAILAFIVMFSAIMMRYAGNRPRINAIKRKDEVT
jgi:hypothetical protein